MAKKVRIRMIAAACATILLLYLLGNIRWGYTNAFFIAIFAFIFLNPVYT